MINTKFLYNNYKVECDYDKNVCFLNTNKKLQYISQPYQIVNYDKDCDKDYDKSIDATTRLYCKMERECDIKEYNKYIQWDYKLCNMAYKYILSQSTRLKRKNNKNKNKNKESSNKYIISKKWKSHHSIKHNTVMYNYGNGNGIRVGVGANKRIYTRVEKELFLKGKESKIVFSTKFVSSIKNLLLDNKNAFICDFIRNVFQYGEDFNLLNSDTLKLSLNKMSYGDKVELIIHLLDNDIPIYVRQKLQFLSIQLEMNKETEICYINTNWKELEKILY
jgi:hypothetical protein